VGIFVGIGVGIEKSIWRFCGFGKRDGKDAVQPAQAMFCRDFLGMIFNILIERRAFQLDDGVCEEKHAKMMAFQASAEK
jgi:hypothetical protein